MAVVAGTFPFEAIDKTLRTLPALMLSMSYNSTTSSLAFIICFSDTTFSLSYEISQTSEME